MTIELKRTEDDYRALQSRAIDRELERAAAGLPPPTVSTKAAARFLGVHFDTLGEWRRRSPPQGPAFQKAPGQAGSGANRHVRYLFADLVAWQESRAHVTGKERRLIDESEALERKRRELELELELRAMREEVAKLQKKLGRISKLENIDDIGVVTHEWALVGGRIAGHVLTIESEVLQQCLDAGDVWGATVQEALSEPWINREARQPFEGAFLEVLQSVESQVMEGRARQRAIDFDAAWGTGADGGERVRPFGDGTRL